MPSLGNKLMRDERGFTLMELLVVMVIVGLLAAIAIPAFFTQRDKAHDAGAKQAARTAALAMEVWANDHAGRYSGAGVADLRQIEVVLNDAALSVDSATPTTYELTVTSTTGTGFSLSRDGMGQTLTQCDDPGQGGCPAGGSWG